MSDPATRANLTFHAAIATPWQVDAEHDWSDTPTRRGGFADGRCKLVGCDNSVPAHALNKFYCSDLCGRLANPEKFVDERDGDLMEAARRRDPVAATDPCPYRQCPTCLGTGAVPKRVER